MNNISGKEYLGKIKYFNGNFGFIKYENGDIYFHKNDINAIEPLGRDDEVKFNIKLSIKKQGAYQAYGILLRKKAEIKDDTAENENCMVGKVKWFNSYKKYGFISAESKDYYIHMRNLHLASSLSKEDIILFTPKKSKKGKLFAINCHPFIVGLNNCPSIKFSKLLQRYIEELSQISCLSDYIQVKAISQSDKIAESLKKSFIISSFEIAKAEYQYKMLFEDGLLDIEKETTESQIELLKENYLNNVWKTRHPLSYDKVKTIAKSDKVTEGAKNVFLKDVFKHAKVEFKHKILFVDQLIDINNETNESQQELFKIYLKNHNIDYDQITSLVNSDNITEAVKKTFLKAILEEINEDYQYKILFKDDLIDIEKETTESQTELLLKYKINLKSSISSNYNHIITILQSYKIEKEAKKAFLIYVFKKADAEYQYKILFEDKLIDIRNESAESQIHLLNTHLKELGRISNSLNYNRIKKILQFDKIIAKEVKNKFLRLAFEHANTDYQYKILFEDNLIDIKNETIENQIGLLKIYLKEISHVSCSSNYERIITILQSNKIAHDVKKSFLMSAFEKANSEYQYKILFEDNLIDIKNETSIVQKEFLLKYEVNLSNNYSCSEYDQIKTIAQSDKILEETRKAFLKYVFNNAIAKYQYKILYEDSLIDIEKETTKSQFELLSKYLSKLGQVSSSSEYDQIKTFAKCKKITKEAKKLFIKLVFKNSNAEYQYKILCKDGFINIEKETTESQTELFQIHSKALGRISYYSEYHQIKTIAQSDKIAEEVRKVFLKSVYEKADTEYRCKMLIDGLITLTEKEQTELLLKYEMKLHHSYFSYYDQLITIAKSNKICEVAKKAFIKSAFEKADTEYQYKMLFEDGLISIKNETTENQIKILKNIGNLKENIHSIDLDKNDFKSNMERAISQVNFNFLSYVKDYNWLSLIKEFNFELYKSLFEQNYFHISKIDRLYLWLKDLNPNYNYLEFVQVAWQLSNDERKLLNKQLKKYAKDKRLQEFIDQIPTATIIEEVGDITIYKCKWRNLYYKNGLVQVFINKTTSSEDYKWEPAREEWNLLTKEYFNRRKIGNIIVKVDSNNHIKDITGLEEIEVKIVIAEITKNGKTGKRVNISSSQITKIIHNVAARNQCINILASQKSNYNVVDIQELVTNKYGSFHRDISFLFPIPNGKGTVFLIWESAEFEKSKATHIFKCSEKELEDMENKIKHFIENNFHTRSRLNSIEENDIEVKKDLQYLCKVNHDNTRYEIWENRMKEVLPFLN